MPLARDLVHPSLEGERRKHKKKRLVQSPNSYFMDVKCPGCYKITTVFSHAQMVVPCVGCATVLCQPTGGKARLTEAGEECGICYRWKCSKVAKSTGRKKGLLLTLQAAHLEESNIERLLHLLYMPLLKAL